jgi:hypothetical protein
MKLMIMHKNDEKTEAGEKPPMELVKQMGELIGEYAKSGRFLDGAGLAGSATRTRMTFRDGRATTKHGPYRGEHESPASVLLLEVPSRDVAIGWAERYGKILGDGEIELGKVNEPWDIGMMPAPENPPLHLLLIEKEGERTSKQKTDLTRLRTEMTKAGVLVRTIHLQSSAKAKRLTFKKNDLHVVDGPFAETKELIGGFAIMEMSDMDEAVTMCRRYAEILGGTLEIDIRVVEQIETSADH